MEQNHSQNHMQVSSDNSITTKELASAVVSWWHSNRENRAALARWRRIRDPEAAFLESTFADFIVSGKLENIERWRLSRVAFALAAAAHVTSNAEAKSFGRAIAEELSGAESGDKRFRKLYESGDSELDKVFRQSLLFIRRLKGNCNVYSLTFLLLDWPRSRRRLAEDFFETYRDKSK